MLTKSARRWQLTSLALALAATVFALVASTWRVLSGRPVQWISTALPLLLLGNAALLVSGWWRTRRRLANGLGAVSVFATLVILIAEVRTL